MPRKAPRLVETELKECRDSINKRNTPKNRQHEVGRTEERAPIETGELAGRGTQRCPTWATTATRSAHAVAEPD